MVTSPILQSLHPRDARRIHAVVDAGQRFQLRSGPRQEFRPRRRRQIAGGRDTRRAAGEGMITATVGAVRRQHCGASCAVHRRPSTTDSSRKKPRTNHGRPAGQPIDDTATTFRRSGEVGEENRTALLMEHATGAWRWLACDGTIRPSQEGTGTVPLPYHHRRDMFRDLLLAGEAYLR